MAAHREPTAPNEAIRELLNANALGVAFVDVGVVPWALPDSPGIVRVGIHRKGFSPIENLDAFDILLSADPNAPHPWVGLPPQQLTEAIAHLGDIVARQPVAAAVAAQVHRMTSALSFDHALVFESLAYSTLLGSEAFRVWRAALPVKPRNDADEPRVRMMREGGVLRICMTRPKARNAVDALMRDALAEALEFALIDPDLAPVELSGEGPCFSSGGDLDEFGQFGDLGRAHAIRLLRAPVRLIQRLGKRVTAHLHGACIGAGIEMPAAAGHVIARAGTSFRLPEVSMGLIPGAGGTASIPRRIGRHRACYMAISGTEIDVTTALAWGLVDGLEPKA